MQRYLFRTWSLGAVYLVVVLATALLIKHVIPPGPWRYVAAVVPTVPLIGVIAAIGLYLREETDEFRRNVYAQSMLWGLGVVLVLTSIWGFLESLAGAPHIAAWWVFPIYSVSQDAARHVIGRWYR
jgi:hypothetical protein